MSEHEHEWQLVEVGVHASGTEKVYGCRLCAAESYSAGQAATEDRPPLDG